MTFGLRVIVRRPVEFDDEFRRGAIKIGGVRTERVFTTKSRATAVTAAQSLPKQLRSFVHIATKLPRPLALLVVVTHDARPRLSGPLQPIAYRF